MFGMLATKMCEPDGRPLSRICRVERSCALYASTEVIDDGESVHRSLPPISMITYWAPCATASRA